MKEREYYAPNGTYGQTLILQAYSGYTKPIAAVLARGLEIEPVRVFPGEIEVPVRAVMPWSPLRDKAWEPYAGVKTVIPSAAPFLYLHRMSRPERRKDYTLFAPFHTTVGVGNSGDWYEIAQTAKALPRPVVVTLHPSDERAGVTKVLMRVFRKETDIHVVTPGDEHYPLYLHNLRKLILNARVACSNNVSTHALYCIALGVPYFMWGPRPSIVTDTDRSLTHLYDTTPEGQAVEDGIYGVFGREPTDTITPEQEEAARFHLGIDRMKDADGLKADFELAESLMRGNRSPR